MKRRNAKKLNCSRGIVYYVFLNMKRLLRQLGRGNSHTREVFIGSLLIHSPYVLPDQELNIKKWIKDSALKGLDWGIKGGKKDFCPWLPKVPYKDEKQINECMLSHVQLFGTLMDCSPPGSYAHGIFQARILGGGCHFLLKGTFQT